MRPSKTLAGGRRLYFRSCSHMVSRFQLEPSLKAAGLTILYVLGNDGSNRKYLVETPPEKWVCMFT
jgi:hypothetical protein